MAIAKYFHFLVDVSMRLTTLRTRPGWRKKWVDRFTHDLDHSFTSSSWDFSKVTNPRSPPPFFRACSYYSESRWLEELFWVLISLLPFSILLRCTPVMVVVVSVSLSVAPRGCSSISRIAVTLDSRRYLCAGRMDCDGCFLFFLPGFMVARNVFVSCWIVEESSRLLILCCV